MASRTARAAARTERPAPQTPATERGRHGGATIEEQVMAMTRREVRARVRRLNEVLASFNHKAAADDRMRRNYRAALGSGDEAQRLDREMVMNFSRRMRLISPPARGFYQRLSRLIVGGGLTPRGGGEIAKQAAAGFRARCDSFEHRGLETWAGLQDMVLQSSFVDGDVLVVKTAERTLQVIEADQIRTPPGKFAAETMRDGVEIDGGGRIIAFHVAEYMPLGKGFKPRTRRIPAEHAIYIAHRDRPSQTRGMPLLSAALHRLAGLDDYLDAVEAAMQLAAIFSLVIKKENAGLQPEFMRTHTEPETASDGTTTATSVMDLRGGGKMLFLEPGEEASQIQGTHPTTQLDSFVTLVLRMACLCLGLPLEFAAMDVSKVNFSTARWASNQAADTADPIREKFLNRFCWPVWEWHCAAEILEGRLPDDEEVHRISWSRPLQRMLDPEKEVRGWAALRDQNFGTGEEIVELRGLEYDEVVERRAMEKKREAELGITPPSTPGSQIVAEAAPDAPADPADKG